MFLENERHPFPGPIFPEDGGTMFLRHTDKTDHFHRNNTKSGCRRVGSL